MSDLPKPFNVENQRQFLFGDCGIRCELSAELNTARSHHSIANFAHSFLRCAIRCQLVMLIDAGHQLSRKAKEWFEFAILEQEVPKPFFPGATEGQRHSELAMCNWLLFAAHDEENLQATVTGYQKWYVEKNLDRGDVLLTLPRFIDAMSYESAIELFERTPRLSAPSDIMRINNGGKMAYVIAQTRSREAYSLSDMRAALDAYLKRSMLGMLSKGHYIDAARWMKIAYFNETSQPLSPEEAILKCYDFLPDMERPDIS